MLFTKDLLFIHVPKTGGMSTTGYLLNVLPKPVYLSHPPEVWTDDLTARGVVQIAGRRHETLAEARDVVARHGFDIDRFPLILATIRNPYDLEVSRYAYLRVGYHWERGPEQDLAFGSSFEEFAANNEQRGGSWTTYESPIEIPPAGDAGYPNDLRDFYTLDGRVPRNLRIVRFERLVEDLRDALRGVGVVVGDDFPWVNQSFHDDYRSYYTPRAEEAVYRRYRWAFDQGFYPRLVCREPEAAPR